MARVAAAAAAIVLAAFLAVSGTSASARPAHPFFVWLHMTSAEDGYALSGTDYLHYRLLRTTDGGRVWHEFTTRHPREAPEIQGTTILFSRTVGHRSFAVERSDDGGHTWTESLPFHNRFGLGAGTPHIIDRKHLYLALDEGAAAGSEGEALYTSSDGHSWHFITQTNVNRTPPGGLPFGCDKNGFGFATPNVGWATGYCAGGGPFFLRTHDAGRHWHRQKLPSATRNCACNTSTPVFFKGRVGVVWTSGLASTVAARPFARVYWTSDGGTHWRASTPTSGRTGAMDVVNRNVVWLFGRLTGNKPGFPRVFRTTNAGRSWHSVGVPAAVSRDDSLDALDATLGFATSGSVLWRTSDGGRHWTAIRGVIAPR